MKVLPVMHQWIRKNLLTFGIHPDPDSGWEPDEPWRRSTLCEYSRYYYIVTV